MFYWNSLEEAHVELERLNRNTVVTVGNFDGVHRGHQAIISRVVEWADRTGGLGLLFSFSNHTDSLLGDKPLFLNQPAVRNVLLAELGLDACLEIEFNKEFAGLSPEGFFSNWLVEGLRAKAIVVGYDFKFGAKGRGDFAFLQALGASRGINVEQAPPVTVEGEVISSSKIRQLLTDGNLDLANKMLGYHYKITGEVIKGEQLARSMGFPTANIRLEPEYLLPAYGVYLVSFTVAGDIYKGIANVGVKPTFGDYKPLIEVHVFDFDMDLYHRRVQVDFLKFIRPERSFPGIEALKIQIEEDIKQAKDLLQT